MSNKPDSRMYWVRNLDRIKAGAQTYEVEYELASEARVVGLLDYGDSSILCGPLTLESDSRGLLKYLLKLRIAQVDHDRLFRGATRRGYVLKDGMIGELAAMLSIALEARFFVLSSSSGELSPRGIKVRREFSPVHRSGEELR